MRKYISPFIALTSLIAACGASDQTPDAVHSDDALQNFPVKIMPIIGGSLPAEPAPPPVEAQGVEAAPVSANNGIGYRGGPIMPGVVSVYYIWYGNWAGNSAPQILTDLVSGLNGSPLYRINTTYNDTTGQSVSGQLRFGGSTSPGYSHGQNLNNSGVWNVVNDALNSSALPVDTNGVYFVVSSKDVSLDGFCSSFCGWHTYNRHNGQAIKFAFIGDAARCNGSCGGLGVTPNGNATADDAASTIFHELSESVSDPQLNAWSSTGNGENGDKCAWKYLTTFREPNGSKANEHLGSRDFLLQSMWANADGGYCGLALNNSPCSPTTCSAQGKNCGSIADGCGGTLSCGSCSSPQSCGGGGTANVCGGGTTCKPTTCAAQGKNCGSIADGCGGTLSCGSCTSPQSCGGGGTANVCGGGTVTGGTCEAAYNQANCLSFISGIKVSSGGHNWTCSNGNCANCASFASCAPGGSGCPWGTVWTDAGACH